ncbi:MAG: N-acetylglucosamine-1-phosphate uridyltransferase / Glucosamine-1-phosphate N-acetyltransferase [Clostridiales bacterium 38_11]|nr:MAG: N-acetylglucosamine-1-phosphate uridyltransferase / Glucosamine-1-phosphate N-acetyltransferase [Clostridiales bacterium 38_11]HBH13252.1 bifunctional UDP-N-acetylglucosamine diphosphorylase/glucosamine-1-phosphate N-acetyltransferase GlmU [Clostridiales bacterium]
MDISIVLAAGEGTRMKSKIPKVLHKICGKEIIKYVIEASHRANIEKCILILGHGREEVIQSLIEYNVLFENQPMGESFPYGTGFAVMQGVRHVNDDDTVLILNGDVPLISSHTLKAFIDFHKKEKASISVMTAIFHNPHGYGRIVRKKTGEVIGIVEEKDASEHEKTIKEVNSGIYCFSGKELKTALKRLDTNNSQNEYYITDAVGLLKKDGKKVCGFRIDDMMEISGINDRYQQYQLNHYKQLEINKNHMMNGVTIIDSHNTYIDDSVMIEKDVIIYPGTILQGTTFISEDCIIGPNATIVDCKVGQGTIIEQSKLIDSVVGKSSSIGPFAYLRPKSIIGDHVKIGDFVEVKNTTIGNGSKASHLAYLGDGEVGDNVNIGCGVIFVNYDGMQKQSTKIGDNAFIGSNSNLVAPVTIEKGAYIACGSTITDDVGEGMLAIARARQVNKEKK